jgi:hypothetical protein
MRGFGRYALHALLSIHRGGALSESEQRLAARCRIQEHVDVDGYVSWNACADQLLQSHYRVASGSDDVARFIVSVRLCALRFDADAERRSDLEFKFRLQPVRIYWGRMKRGAGPRRNAQLDRAAQKLTLSPLRN